MTDSAKYSRGKGTGVKNVKNRQLKEKIKRTEAKYKQAAKEAARTEYLLLEQPGFLEAEDDLEQTYKLKQDEILKHVDVATQKKRFDLKLDQFGPYYIDYSRTGNSVILAGSKGHLAAFDWKQAQLKTEINVKEHIRAVKWLQSDDQFFAVAQKKHTFIYDHNGMEVHCLKKHVEATCLEYLPYHFLLVSGGGSGFLTYQDVSTGQLVADLRTKLGPTTALCQNPWNAVIQAGHSNGTVTLWAPNTPTPLVKVQSSRGPVRSIAVNRTGNYMAVAGADCSIRIWDVRNTYKEVNYYFSPSAPSSISISDTGLLAVGSGSIVEVWKDPMMTSSSSSSLHAQQTTSQPQKKKPYMKHSLFGTEARSVKFCPFEDVLGIGHKTGFSSIIVPGSGEANFDSLEVNPYMNASKSSRRENEVKQLLNKLQWDMICLDPDTLGSVDRRAASVRFKSLQEKQDWERKRQREEEESGEGGRKKSRNIIEERQLQRERSLQVQKQMQEKKMRRLRGEFEDGESQGAALDRFRA